MRFTFRHWSAALLAALLLHAGLIAGLLWMPSDEGAMAAGVGGIEIGLGPAGGAPGTVAREAADLPEAETDTAADSADEAVPEETVEPVEVETAETVEAPMESASLEVPDLAEALPEEAEAVVAESTPVAEPLPAELAEAVPIEEALAAAEPPQLEEVAASEPPSEAPPPEPQEVAAEVPVDPPAPRTKPERPQPKPVQSTPEPKPQTAEQPKPVEAEPTPPTAEAVAEAAGSSAPSDRQTANVAPSMAGDDGKAGSKGRPDVGEGDGTTAGGIGALQRSYAAQLRSWLQKHKKYPRRAKLRNQQGTPVVQIRIDRDGMVLLSDVTQPSGYRLLDREALKTIQRAEPMPKPPAELQGDALTFVVPLDFVLK